MLSTVFLSILSLSGALALPGLSIPRRHHHHAKRDDVVVYATVQVTEYITMTAGQSESSVLPVQNLEVNNFAKAQATTLTTSSTPAAPVLPASSSSAASLTAPTTYPITTTTTPTTSATPVPATSTAATKAATTTSSSSSTSAGGKKGIAWAGTNPSSMVSLFDSGAVNWYFNWGTSTTPGFSSAQTFIYQQWGSNNMANVNSIPHGSTLIGFNEPDGSGQATMTPAQAAAYYHSTLTPLRKTGQVASLGTPSITNGGSPAGIAWLTTFMAACADCEIDFVSAHWYGPSMSLLQSQMTAIHTAFNLPIWITEMACTEWSASSNPSQSQVASFMSDAVSWMESTSWIAKYAWFGAMVITDSSLGASNMLVTSDGTGLSDLGKQYLSS